MSANDILNILFVPPGGNIHLDGFKRDIEDKCGKLL
jgi:hypothetical protein